MDVIVKNSGIEGKGVFAARDFKKGETVLKWDISNQLTDGQVKRLPEDEKKYVTHVAGKYVLMQPPERFVNHSCDANTTSDNFSDVAKRDIGKGEEITGDYGETTPGSKMECSCGSRNCRKVIVRNGV